MGWYCRGQLFKEIEDAAFKLKKGEMSRPFLSTIGYHILLVNDRKSMEEYDVVKERLSDEVGRRKIHQQTTATAIMGQPLVKENAAAFAVSGIQDPTDPLQQEYYEGLLLIEQSKQSVGRRAAEDEEALRYYFKKNKKKYRRKGFKPKDYTEVRELVVADLQEEMNKHWVADLRKQYPVKVNKKVLKTVNNHR
jgi:peptidyl-prolyl cis-trans isomerase SurA